MMIRVINKGFVDSENTSLNNYHLKQWSGTPLVQANANSTSIITTSRNNQKLHHIFFPNDDKKDPTMQSSILANWGFFKQIKSRYSFEQRTNGYASSNSWRDVWLLKTIDNHAMSYSRTMFCRAELLYPFTPYWTVTRLILFLYWGFWTEIQ